LLAAEFDAVSAALCGPVAVAQAASTRPATRVVITTATSRMGRMGPDRIGVLYSTLSSSPDLSAAAGQNVPTAFGRWSTTPTISAVPAARDKCCVGVEPGVVGVSPGVYHLGNTSPWSCAAPTRTQPS